MCSFYHQSIINTMVMLHTFKVCGFTASCQRIVPPLTFINPTCSLYAYNSLILKYRFF